MEDKRMKLQKITDRAVYSMFALLSCKYELECGPVSERTCTMRINRAYRNLFTKQLALECPWTVADIRKTNTSVSFSGINHTTCECTHIFQIEIESPDNAPDVLGEGFMKMVIDSMVADKANAIKKISITSDIAIHDVLKGYIQLDNSLYFPSQI